MTLLETALDLARRGFHVFPLAPRDKFPIVAGGFKAATKDQDQVRLWWTKNPGANIGIGCEVSQLCVVDCDHGFTRLEDFIAWRDRNGLPPTYTVRSGRRPEFGVQMYYRGPLPTTRWTLDGCSGDIKSIGGLVVAPPSIHPDSGEAYTVLLDLPIAPTPDVIKQLKKPVETKADLGGIETNNRNDEMCSFIGKVRKQLDLSEPECLVLCLQRNERYKKGPLPEQEVTEIVAKQYRLYPDVGPDPVVTIGKPEENKVTDWRELFHSQEETRNAPPIRFLIEGFLQCDGVTAIAAPVGARKTLTALNVSHALVTGEPLFGHFKVTRKPSRVIYLCPEVSLSPFADRVKKIGLLEHVGKGFFYRTLSAEGTLKLSDPILREGLPGSVVILDTAIRFLTGDENSSTDMRIFAEEIFSLLRKRADAVILLHHSPKGSSKDNSITLDNAMRGSGELAAFLTACWGTQLQNPDEPYTSASYLKNVKQRDFEANPFEVTSGPDCRLHFVGDGSEIAHLASRSNPADKDGKEDAALQLMRDNPTLSLRKTVAALKAAGIERGMTWVRQKRSEIKGTGVRSGETAV